MTASIQLGKHHRVDPVGLSFVTGFSGDQRRCDDLTVKAISLQDPMQDKTGTSGLVTGSHDALFRHTPEQAPDFHQIPRHLQDIGLLLVALEDRGGDRIDVHV